MKQKKTKKNLTNCRLVKFCYYRANIQKTSEASFNFLNKKAEQ